MVVWHTQNTCGGRESARKDLEFILNACRLLNMPVVDRQLYTQWPVPSNPQIALSVSSTFTYTSVPPFKTSSRPSAANRVSASGAVAAAAVVAHLVL